MLYIVSTPIGNLEDITIRAINTLKEADLIAAEDTRHAKILLNKYEIKTTLQSYHAHSDQKKLNHLIGLMLEGKSVALISDAGTPGISDPGYVLINEAIKQGIQVVPIPGAAAFLTALSASGLPTHQFLYLGFLPQKKGRKTLLKSLKQETRTVVFYESPHRIIKTLMELDELFPEESAQIVQPAQSEPSDRHEKADQTARTLVIGRELTKIHEEFFRGSAQQALLHFGGPDYKNPKKAKKVRGELVVMLAPPQK